MKRNKNVKTRLRLVKPKEQKASLSLIGFASLLILLGIAASLAVALGV